MTPTHLARLIDALIALFDPVVQAIDNADNAEALLRDLGYQPPAGVAFLDDFSPLLEALMDVAEHADDMLRGDTEPDYRALVSGLFDALRDVIGLVRDSGTTLEANFAADFLAATDIVALFPRQLADYLVVKMLERQYPVLHSSLLVCGVLDEGNVATAPTPFHTPYKKRVVRWDKIGGYVSSPLSSVQEAYGWDTANFDYGRLVGTVHHFGQTLGFFSSLTSPEPDALRAFHGGLDVITDENAEQLLILKFPLLPVFDAGVGIEIYPLLNAAGDAVGGLGVGVYFDPANGLEFPITDRLTLRIKYSGVVALDAGVSILPGQPLQQVGTVFGGAATQADLSVFTPEFGFADAEQKTVLLDSPLAKLDFASSAVRGGVLPGVSGFYFETAFEGATLTLGTSEGDGFLRQVLPAEPMSLDFSLTVGFSSKTGLYFGGSSALEVQLPAHAEIGPVAIQALTVALTAADGKIPVSFGADVTVALGPLLAVVENVGVTATLSFPPDNSGNFGPLQFDLGFKPPSGLGLTVDGGGFKGGGFLGFDPEASRYSGMLELQFQDQFTLKAFGVLETRLPGGQPGFSLIVVISAEFTPIQLGFGFTLNGVGGLLGLHRTANVDRLVSGLRDRTLANLLFPVDIVANADRILSDLRQVFPASRGRFIFGPMAKIGWGTPTLLTADVGLLLEVPEPVRLMVLGVVRGILPDERTAILRLQVNFLGVIDFEQERFSFDASLFDSTLLSFALSGDMAMRLYWGEHANFLATVGGFHPAYQPPPMNLPALRRLTLSLVGGENPRLTLETYFALTSNTAQFGARLELYAAAWKFNAYGFLSFDVLVQFNPFYFVAEVTAMLALRVGSSSIASIKLTLTLEGPTPWKAKGDARLKLCWFLTVKIRFNKTFGETRNTTLPDLAVLPLVKQALEARDNWVDQKPPQRHRLESLRELPAGAAEPVRVHPVGTIAISQKVVPLEITIDRIGAQRPADARTFTIGAVTVNGESQGTPPPAEESFAPAQFFDLTDAEKLASPSFKSFASGIRVGDAERMRTGYAAAREVQYEIKYIDSARDQRLAEPPTSGLFDLDAHAFNAWALKGAIAQSELSFARRRKSARAPDEVTTRQEPFVIVHGSDLSPFDADSVSGTEVAALRRRDALIARDPALRGLLQVVPLFEMSA